MSFISGTDATATTPPVNERKHIRALRAALQAELLQAKREGYFGSIAKYLMRTEVHTFAFSVAANVAVRRRHDKIGMRSLSTDCDSVQEPQPRKLSCRISTVLEELNTRHASILQRGHDIQTQRIL